MAHIGNGHNQAEIAADFFGIHGIIEIAGGFAIDGHQGQIAQIHPAFNIIRAHFIGNFRRFLQAGFAEHMRQMMLAHGDFDFHAAVGIIAQHFDKLGYGRAVAVGIAVDFRHHHLPLLGLECG